MNEVMTFSNDEFGTIRTLSINNEPWFVGKDICSKLGYKNPSKSIKDHVDDEDKLNNESLSSLGQRGGWLINESGLYSLILSSKLESAKRFKRWVTSEVLPSIRKSGGYIAGQEDMSDADLMAKALLVAQRQIDERQKQIEEMTPHAILGQAITTANTSILVGDLAKLLRQNGIKIGGKRLFEWMRENGYLIKRKGTDWNLPTQRSMDMELFEIKESVHIDGNGCNKIARTPKVTGKGQAYFINKFLSQQV